MLSQMMVDQLWAWLVVFLRIGSAFTIMPIFADSFMPTPVRLLVALGLSVLLAPVLGEVLPQLPDQPLQFVVLVAGEIITGIFIGTVGRLMFSALDTAGMIIAMQSSLANASVFNPAMASQSSLPGTMLSSLAILLILVSDLHHLLLLALADSYNVFVPGRPIPVNDFSDTVARLVAESFAVGLEMTAPFLIAGTVIAVAMGLLARLAPQIQVFFVFMSGQVAFGLWLMMLTLSSMMLFWLKHFQDVMMHFLSPP